MIDLNSIIVGDDIGNYGVKVSDGVNNLTFKSIISRENLNVLTNSKHLILDDGNEYFIGGNGKFETELNKAKKQNFLPLMLASLCMVTPNPEDSFNTIYKVVCGLPINQYKQNKDELEAMILDKKIHYVNFEGKDRRILIDECKVYPECLGAYYSLDNGLTDIILIDIGGRTTDIAYISNGKLIKASTIAVGTLNIYADISHRLNSMYSLTVNLNRVDKILKDKLFYVDGESIDLTFIVNILRENFFTIKEELDLNYPARTEMIVLSGGGAELFETAFKKRYRNCRLHNDCIFGNARGFKKVGELLWPRTL